MSERMTIGEAVGLTKQFARFLKGLERLQEAADELAGVEQLVRERGEQAERLQTEIAAAQSARDDITAEAIDTRQRAQRDAENAIAAATERAAEIRDQAKAELKAALAEAEQARAKVAHDEELARLAREDAKTARAELEQIRSDLEAAKAEARRRFG